MSDLKRVIGVQVAGQAAEPLAKVAGVQASAPAGLGRVRAVDVLLARGLPGQDGDAATLERLTAADAKLAEMEAALADTAQSAADAAAAAGLIPHTAGDHTTLPAAAGDYRILRGPEAGQVWTRATQGAAPQRNEALEITPMPRNAPIPPQFFGMHIHPNNTPRYELGYGTVRLWDSGTSWRQLEGVGKGQWTWATLDALVDRYHARGLDIILTLGQAPNWATGGTSSSNAGAGYNTLPPTNTQDWVDYVQAVAQRYNGKIKYWEVWNEPNLTTTFYSGTVAQLVELHRLAQLTLQAVNPQNVILSACPTGDQGGDGPAYLAQMLAAGVGPYVDVFAVHLYGEAEPEARIEAAQRYRALMSQYGYANRELWDTESGYHDHRNWLTGAKSGTVMSDPQSVAYILRHHLTALAGGVDRAVWYGEGYTFPRLDLVRDGALTPAGLAYQQLAADLIGARVREYARLPGGAHALTLTRDGTDWAYLWTGDRVRTRVLNNGTVALGAVQRGLDPETGPDAATLEIDATPTRVTRAGQTRQPLNPALLADNVVTAHPASLNPLMLPVNGAAGGDPAGWNLSAVTVADYAGPLSASGDARPIVVTTSAQYGGMNQRVAEWVRPGERYRITCEYSLPASTASKEWMVWVTVGPFGGLLLPALQLPVTGAGVKQRVSVEGEVPFGLPLSPDVTLRLNNNLTSGHAPITLFDLRIERLSEGRPATLPPPIYERTTAKYPATGSWRLGERARILDTTDARTYGEFLTCTSEGTFGTVPAGATVTATANTTFITVSGATLQPGQVIVLPGSTKRLSVSRATETPGQYQLTSNADVTVNAGTLAFAPPVFSALASPDPSLASVAAYTATQAGTLQYAKAEYRWKATGAAAGQQQVQAALMLSAAGPGANASWHLEHQDSAGATVRRFLAYDMNTQRLDVNTGAGQFIVNGTGGVQLRQGNVFIDHATVNTEKNLYWTNNYAYRWTFRMTDADTGTGSVGSNLSIQRVLDSGAFGMVMHLKRDTGYVAVGGSNPTEQLDVRGNIKLSGITKTTPLTLATLPAAGTAGAGSIATVSNPAAGKSNVVYSNGTNWLYMDGSVAV